MIISSKAYDEKCQFVEKNSYHLVTFTEWEKYAFIHQETLATFLWYSTDHVL